MRKEELSYLRFNQEKIAEKTKKIYRRTVNEIENFKDGNITRICPNDLKLLFDLYDSHFFDGFFSGNYGGKICFNLSRRMTRSAGKVEHVKPSGIFVITLSSTLIFQTFHEVKREVVVNGIVCYDRLEAVMRVLEHEIIHLMELLLFGSSSCAKSRFRAMSRNVFNHTDVTHQLVTQPEIAHQKYSLHVGDAVSFEYQGITFRGFINRISRRATVLVKDKKGIFKDSQGMRYAKFYIPLHFLKANKAQIRR
ncbi:MAG: hypothetical protein HQ591_05455 [candidate division Zixibacteria bacterium]|nr:hypothetical protein [Candidatus Tariuqbacter arcticus]